MSEPIFEKRLTEIGFPGLFMYGERGPVSSIWENGKNKKELEDIVYDSTGSFYAKFLAAEILRKYNVPFAEDKAGILSGIYAMALKNTSEAAENKYFLNGNLWGMLYESDDPGRPESLNIPASLTAGLRGDGFSAGINYTGMFDVLGNSGYTHMLGVNLQFDLPGGRR